MKVQICTWKSCKSRFSEYILKRLESDKEKFHYESLTIETCPCLWSCSEWPNVLIDWKKENYSDPIKISKIISDRLKQASISKKSLKKDKNDENQIEE